MNDLKNLEDLFDCIYLYLSENHEGLFSKKNKKVFEELSIENPQSIWIEFDCLRRKMYAFKCGSNEKGILKSVSKFQSKNIEFEEYYNCLFGGEYKKEYDNYLIRSINHEMYLKKVTKNSLSPFDDKGCYENNIKRRPWKYYY